MEFTEYINVDKAKFLLSHSDEELKKIIIRGEDDWKGENLFNNIDTYLSQFKMWLKRSISIISNNQKLKCNYKYSKNLINCGRLYVKDFGVQKLTRELRGFLISDYSLDFDMKNAHPTILYYILNKYFPDYKYQYLEMYIKNREQFLKDAKVDKKKILVSMNSNKNIISDSSIFYKLDKEFKQIQKLLFNHYEEKNKDMPDILKVIKSGLKQNKEGRFLNLLCCINENDILQKVIEHFKKEVHTPFFDGLTLNNNINKEDTLNKLNDITKEYNIKWNIKEHDKSIIYDKNREITFNPILSYEQQKIIFEKNHFMIESILTYCKTHNDNEGAKYYLYGKDKFRDLVRPFKCFVGKEEEFFKLWIQDPNRKMYKDIRFYPKLEDNKKYFNSFDGFNYIKNDDYDENVINLFKNHIDLLVNKETEGEEASEYLIQYIAHLIQKPEEKPGTAIVLKSRQGFGKDTLIDMIQELINNRYVFRTADIDDIFGTYNVGIRDKLIVQLNELEGKDGFSNKEKVKNLITEDKTIIREKYVTQYEQQNFTRLFILSNNLNPIEISHDDRRFIVFKSNYKKPDTKYFNDLHDMIKDKNKMQILFNYLYNYDISDFNARNDRPKTTAYNTMKEHNKNPLYRFLYDNFINNEFINNFESNECIKNKKKNLFYVKSKSLYDAFKIYLETENMDYIKPNFRILKSLLSDIGIDKKQVKISGVNSDYNIIYPNDLKLQLSALDVEEEDIEEPDLEDLEFF